MKKCKDWTVEHILTAKCPSCKSHYEENLGTDKPEKGDEVECSNCGETFLLG